MRSLHSMKITYNNFLFTFCSNILKKNSKNIHVYYTYMYVCTKNIITKDMLSKDDGLMKSIYG